MRAYFKVIQVSLCLCWQCKKNSAIEGVTDHVMLTPIHDILRSQCKQHNVEEQHGQYQHQNQKQQSLRHSFARTDFIKLCFVSKGISMIITKTIQTFFWIKVNSQSVSAGSLRDSILFKRHYITQCLNAVCNKTTKCL